jgi:hypothetical protein
MWRDYKQIYGSEATGICNRYLDMQLFNNDPEEIQFCKELYSAMLAEPILSEQNKITTKGENHAMNENTTPQGDNSPLAENQYVKELFSILNDNGRDTSGLSALLGHVNEMESFVKTAESTISDMKRQLDGMKEIQNHPVKTALQNAIKTLETKVAEVKERLGELKANIISGCKEAVSAFKQKGISALNSLASFFRVKDGLDGWKKDIDFTIQADNKAIAKIEAFSTEYHSAGRAIKNMARVAIGRPPLDAKKEAGKLSKTIAAPYKVQKSALTSLKKSIDKAISAIDRMEQTETVKQAERVITKKPPLMQRMAANKERVAQVKLEMPTPDRTKTKGLEV